jgi:hypothetical protein
MAESFNRGKADAETLTLIYEDRVRERERLRDARRAITAQLGPLPAAAAVIIGLFATFAKDIRSEEPLFLAALGAFVLVILVSALSVDLSPYRAMRANHETELGSFDRLPRDKWLERMISLEREIYGHDPKSPRSSGLKTISRDLLLAAQDLVKRSRGRERPPATLIGAYDSERRSLHLVQVLVGLEVVALVTAAIL